MNLLPLLLSLVLAGLFLTNVVHIEAAAYVPYGDYDSAVMLTNLTSNYTLTSFTNVTTFLGSLHIYGGPAPTLAGTDSICNISTNIYAKLTEVFANLREIRGSLFLGDAACLSDYKFLKNLVVIRGTSLLPSGHALLINSSKLGTTQLGLASLTTVLGPIGFGGTNPINLCGKGNIPLSWGGVNLTALVPGPLLSDVSNSSSRTVTINLLGKGTSVTVAYPFDGLNGVSNCPNPFCDPSCNNACWASNDPNYCQLICSASCGTAGCVNGSTTTCCSAACLGGCASDGTCYACADGYLLMPDGTCVASTCPLGYYPVGAKAVPVGSLCVNEFPVVTHLVFNGFDCVQICPLDTYLWNNTCVRGCPDGNKPVNGVCLQGLAPRGIVCTGIDKVSTVCESAIVASQNCTVLVGSINVTSLTSYSSYGGLINVGSLQVVTGFISVFSTNFLTLSGLSSLTDIDASPPERLSRASLIVERNNGMQYLGLTKLLRIGGSAAIIRNNYGLCLQNAPNWNLLFSNAMSVSLTEVFTLDYLLTAAIGIRREQVSGFYKEPNNWVSSNMTNLPTCDQIQCHSMCNGRGCWSPAAADCQHCPNNQALRYGMCVPGCNSNVTETYPVPYASRLKVYYPANLDVTLHTDKYGCLTCDASCATCNGTTNYDCTSCPAGLVLRPDHSCAAACELTNPGQYVDSNYSCQYCNANCRTCNNSDTYCISCSSTKNLFLYDTNHTCLSTCPDGRYPLSTTRVCEHCDSTCGKCVKSGSCTACNLPRYLQGDQCVLTCNPGRFANAVNNANSCDFCNQACVTCNGPTQYNCSSCNIAAQYYRIPSTMTCLLPSQTPPGTFANSATGQFDACIANCTTCTSTVTCDACTPPYVMNATRQCVASSSCDANSYQLSAATQLVAIQCATLSTCLANNSQYQTVAPTLTTNRVCGVYTVCNTSFQYISVPPTATSNLACGACRTCPSNRIVDRFCDGKLDTTCVVRPVCTPNPCLQGGTCINNDGVDYTCQCVSPYAGAVCDIDTSVCSPNPCHNGTCTALRNATFACTCPVNISGTFCSIDARVCAGTPCRNNGTCVPQPDFKYTCDCLPGYIDADCGTLASAASSSASFAVATYVGAAGGGIGFLVLMILVILYVVRRRRRQRKRPIKSDYLTLRKADEWELDRTLVTLGKMIGSGQFGQVMRGMYQHPSREGHAMHVAVKCLKDGAQGSNDEKDFFAEMRMMKQIGRHKHVLSLVGVCTLEEPVLLVLEYADDGDLRTYLRDRRPTPTRPAAVLADDMLLYAFQIACGMEFLASLKIVHRDLAARNVLVAKGPLMKVADFGLSRNVVDDNVYVKSSEGKVPFKWMAPESLMDRVFTSQSDVWSFGVTLWEISCYGATPYPGHENGEMMELLESGYRMLPPDDCPDPLYKVMAQCWQWRAEDRPTFAKLREGLSILANIPAEYMDGVVMARFTLVPPSRATTAATFTASTLAPITEANNYTMPDAMPDYLVPGLPVNTTGTMKSTTTMQPPSPGYATTITNRPTSYAMATSSNANPYEQAAGVPPTNTTEQAYLEPVVMGTTNMPDPSYSVVGGATGHAYTAVGPKDAHATVYNVAGAKGRKDESGYELPMGSKAVPNNNASISGYVEPAQLGLVANPYTEIGAGGLGAGVGSGAGAGSGVGGSDYAYAQSGGGSSGGGSIKYDRATDANLIPGVIQQTDFDDPTTYRVAGQPDGVDPMANPFYESHNSIKSK